jgi:hypothetical protein
MVSALARQQDIHCAVETLARTMDCVHLFGAVAPQAIPTPMTDTIPAGRGTSYSAQPRRLLDLRELAWPRMMCP